MQSIKNILWHFPKSVYYNYHYRHPSKGLVIIGVTGTDGKTTTTELIYQTLLQNGIKAGQISTLGAKIGEKNINIGLHTTSPDAAIVQKIFRQMVDEGITHVVVEVTAHAIDQFRFFGCHFQIAVLTNTSHEHLDDFIDMNQYILTKGKLFKYCDISILNKDDQSYELIRPSVSNKLISYSINSSSDYKATNLVVTKNELTFHVNNIKISTDSPFQYQAYNILAALAASESLKLSTPTFVKLVTKFPEVKGRREIVNNNLGITTIIDFAHTPAALESTLNSLKKICPGKLIVIFGATGGRDQTKRPLMGKIVSQISDYAIVTSDDTRNEKIEDINQQIIDGFDNKRLATKSFAYFNIPNRQDAFNQAVKIAKKGDTIIACGKGHETTILHGKTEYPWSESEAFRTAFRLSTQNHD